MTTNANQIAEQIFSAGFSTIEKTNPVEININGKDFTVFAEYHHGSKKTLCWIKSYDEIGNTQNLSDMLDDANENSQVVKDIEKILEAKI